MSKYDKVMERMRSIKKPIPIKGWKPKEEKMVGKPKFIEVKDPKGKVVAKAEVASRTNQFVHYFVLKYKDGHYSCNCGDYIFHRPKGGCDHIRYATGKIKSL